MNSWIAVWSVIGSFLAMLFLASVGNRFDEWVAKPLLLKAGRGMMSLRARVLQGILNGVIRSAAVRPIYSIQLYAAIVLAILPTYFFYPLSAEVTKISDTARASDVAAAINQIKEQAPPDQAQARIAGYIQTKKRELLREVVTFWVLAQVIMAYWVTRRAMIFSIIQRFDHMLAVAGPTLTKQREAILRRRFALMTTLEDWHGLSAELKALGADAIPDHEVSLRPI